MIWTISLTSRAEKTLQKLDRSAQERIRQFLDVLADTQNPRAQGEALQGKHGYWRYRVGDYRIIAQIRDREWIILVVHLGHRGSVYRDWP